MPDQCWWSLGYRVAFLAHLHLHTGDPDFLATAENILEFVGRCDDDVRNNIVRKGEQGEPSSARSPANASTGSSCGTSPATSSRRRRSAVA